MSSKTQEKEHLIYVTGFGLFGNHVEVNASWEAVRLLPSTHVLANGEQCRIQVREIAVTYTDVDRAVDEIWADEPELVIHCGVHPSTRAILLEKQSLNCGYFRPDEAGKRLKCDVVQLNSVSIIKKTNCTTKTVALCTSLDVNSLVHRLSESLNDIECSASYDVGNFLCGYSYLMSLDRNADRTLFIHVPLVDQPYSSGETCRMILRTIELCLEQINTRKTT